MERKDAEKKEERQKTEEIKSPEAKNPEIEKIKKGLRAKGRKKTYYPVGNCWVEV